MSRVWHWYANLIFHPDSVIGGILRLGSFYHSHITVENGNALPRSKWSVSELSNYPWFSTLWLDGWLLNYYWSMIFSTSICRLCMKIFSIDLWQAMNMIILWTLHGPKDTDNRQWTWSYCCMWWMMTCRNLGAKSSSTLASQRPETFNGHINRFAETLQCKYVVLSLTYVSCRTYLH